MKKKVLILGKTGMLGHMVERVFAESGNIEVQGTHIADQTDPFYFDVMKGVEGLAKICDFSGVYDFFINCIGMVTGKIDEKNPSAVRKTIMLNALFPHELAGFARERGIKVIHISTDGVFSGTADGYYEDGTHDCPDFYGISKSLGEVNSGNFINLRTSIIGPSPFEKRGLLEWFLQQPDGGTVKGFTNHVWHGVSTYQFGMLCLKIIEGNHFDHVRKESPVFHFAPNEPLTKYELLCLFKENFKKRITIDAVASENSIKRVLNTRFQSLKTIFPHSIPAAKMVSELADFMENGNQGDNHGN